MLLKGENFKITLQGLACFLSAFLASFYCVHAMPYIYGLICLDYLAGLCSQSLNWGVATFPSLEIAHQDMISFSWGGKGAGREGGWEGRRWDDIYRADWELMVSSI